MADGGILGLLFLEYVNLYGVLLNIWTSITCHDKWKDHAKFQLANSRNRLLPSHGGSKNGEA